MVDETLEQNPDYFSDGDFADAENLPEGPRYIGYVSKVDTSQTEPGKYRKLDPDTIRKSANLRKALAGRDEVPQVDVDITALGRVGQGRFDPDTNYYRTSSQSFWIGKEDRIGRHSLARLIRDAAGVDEEMLKTTPIREAATKLEKVYLTFEVKYRKFETRSGGEGVAQDFKKIKPATLEEIEAVQ